MSLLVLGLSHHKAPMELLERVQADDERATALERLALAGEHLREAMVVSTCNRTEMYAEARTFHGALAELTTAFTTLTGVPLAELQPHLYVHYDERGVAHAFNVAAGLESMAVGEAQILGQLRLALRRAQHHGHLGPELNALFQQAFRVGKRVHSQTGIDAVSRSLVDAALGVAEGVLGDLSAARVLVVGAGGMGALAAATISRRGVGGLTVTNRTPSRGRSLAQRLDAVALPWAEVAAALPEADVVISSTGAPGFVLPVEAVSAAGRARGGRTQVLVDLALPRDIDPDVADLDHVHLLGLGELGALLSATGEAPEVTAASELVTAAVAEYLTAQLAASVTPTVSALRRRADEVVRAEMERLTHRVATLSDTDRAEVERTVRRVVEKLLHAPTVRVKELAERGQGGSYARALSELFDLDHRDVQLVSAPVTLPYGMEQDQ